MEFFYKNAVPFHSLKGQVIKEVIVGTYLGNDAIIIKTKDKSYIMYHEQDCCEEVSIEDICGDINDILGEEVLVAEDVENDTDSPNEEKVEDTWTWTFYKISTFHGDVTIRWFGTSNGFYSESVCLYEIDEPDYVSAFQTSKRYGKD